MSGVLPSSTVFNARKNSQQYLSLSTVKMISVMTPRLKKEEQKSCTNRKPILLNYQLKMTLNCLTFEQNSHKVVIRSFFI